ncbi:DUF998 domain-containing protein [Rugosimonospora acidiphila]|uniref:DUF998 domain-containing protein n=1 Tax=Rugosimonospora acidiphila TaxID=556531 RepID=A0ABP9S2V5_9ACTN
MLNERHDPVGTLTGSEPPHRRVAWWVLVCAALCPTLPTAGWLVGDAVQPEGYSPVHQTISILAGHAGAHRWIVTSALVLVGVCYGAIAAGLTALRRPARIGLAVGGASAIGVALCPEPVRGTTVQHLTFAVICTASLAAWPALTAWRGPRTCAVVSVPVAAVTTGLFVAMLGWLFVEAQTDGLVGLAERIDTSIQACWPFVVAMALQRAAPAAVATAAAPATATAAISPAATAEGLGITAEG